jgi:sialate O-acetylesterase
MGGEWKTASAESVAGFSAIGWFFAKKLNAGLNIPIGIIHASWGGTAIRTWLDRESLELFIDSINLPPVPQNFNPEEWEKTAAASIEKHRVRRNQISYPKKGLAEQITMSGYDDSAWAEIGFPFEKNSNVAWLRKKIVIPDKIVNQPLQLSLRFLNRQSQVFFNETELGYFQYPEPVKTEIPHEIIKPGENLLTIRLAQPFGAVEIMGEKEQFFITNTNGSFYKNLEEGWKINSGLEPVNAAEESFQNNPAFLFNGMVAPVIPYGIKGFIWFQGESDAGRPFLYEKMFQQLITDWRRRWQLGNLPFLFIQVSNIELSHHFEDFDDSRCLIRLAQQKALELPNTGMVVSADIGDPYDVHPKNKKEFAERLVVQAEKKAYGKKVIADSPLAKSFQVKNKRIIVKLKTEGKPIIKGKEDLNGFEIAGADNQYFPAKVRLKGSRIFISSPKIKNPTAARYAWRNNPKCSLYNAAGLPAAPFSTRFLKKEK